MTSKKHEPVSDHDNERSAFEDWCGKKYSTDRFTDAVYNHMTWYVSSTTERMWEAWQARAAVKPVQDDALGKLCELRDRAANVTLSVIPELANGLFTENYVVSQKHVKHLAELLSYLDRHGVKPAASTGNTEERKLDVLYERCRGDIRPMLPLMSPIFSESPPSGISEEEAVEVMARAACVRVYKERGIAFPEDYEDGAHKYYLNDMRTAYRALLPHLSDTSAEKARVEDKYYQFTKMCATMLATYNRDDAMEKLDFIIARADRLIPDKGNK